MLRASLIAASLLEIALAGIVVLDVAAHGGLGIVPAAVAAVVALQGGFTLAHLGLIRTRWGHVSRGTLIAGETAALLVGGAAAVIGLLAALHPVNGDVELAPMLMGGAMAAQASLGLLHAAVEERHPAT